MVVYQELHEVLMQTFVAGSISSQHESIWLYSRSKTKIRKDPRLVGHNEFKEHVLLIFCKMLPLLCHKFKGRIFYFDFHYHNRSRQKYVWISKLLYHSGKSYLQWVDLSSFRFTPGIPALDMLPSERLQGVTIWHGSIESGGILQFRICRASKLM